MNKADHDAGYAIFPHMFSARECAAIGKALGSKTGRAGMRNLMSHPAVAAIAFAPRLLDLARATLGTEAIPFRATLFEKSSDANWHVVWHQDRTLPLCSRIESAEWGPWTIKGGVICGLAPGWALERVVALRVSVDACTSSNGPLRVIPGSHKHGVLSASDISRLTREHEARTCMVDAGGVLVMRPLLLHSSTKSRSHAARRVIHLEYATSLEVGSGLRLSVV